MDSILTLLLANWGSLAISPNPFLPPFLICKIMTIVPTP